MKYSIVVPCYNEAEVLPLFRQRLDAVLADPQFSDSEVILIDDGSSDATWQLIQDFCAEDKKYKGLSLSRNFGHQLALSAGLKHSIGELVFVCDADLQDPPELLPAMLNTMIEQQADVVYGVRKERSKETWFKKISANFFYRLLAKLSDCHIPRDTGDCPLMRRVIVAILYDMPERDRFIRGMIAWMGFRQVPHFYDRPGQHRG